MFSHPDPDKQFQLSPIKAIELAAAKIAGTVSLAQGIPSFHTPDVIRSFVHEKIMQGACDKYSLTTGLAELREEISIALEKEGLRYDPEREIIVTCGSIEGITAALLAWTSPGDEVLIPSPSYASYSGSVYLSRCTPRFFQLDEDANFDFQVEQIERALSRRTKVILYCSPNNPTGTLFSQAKTRKLLELAERHDLMVLIDEVYKDFYYSDDPHFTPASIPEARRRVVRVCSFSKAFAMTGWRVGFVHGDHSRLQRILKYHDAMVTCAPVASQYAAIAALRFGEGFLRDFREEFKARRDFTIKVLDQLSHVLDYQTPKAAYFVFPRLKDTVPLARDSYALAYDILEKARVAVVPGAAFGPSGESHLRITFGRSKEDLEEGLSRLGNYFSDLRRSRGKSGEHRPAPPSPAARSAAGGALRPVVISSLSLAARIYLKRASPVVIGIAGILGKTVVKRTVSELLSVHFRVRTSILSYNTETGLPLSILNLQAPRNQKERRRFLLKLLSRTLLAREFPQVFVLEYGISSPQDAAHLRAIARPDWLIITDMAANDPSIPRDRVEAGIKLIAQSVSADRVLWAGDDDWVKGVRSDLHEDLKLDEQAVLADSIRTSSRLYPIHTVPVSRSGKLALLAALILSEKLGMSAESAEQYLKR